MLELDLDQRLRDYFRAELDADGASTGLHSAVLSIPESVPSARLSRRTVLLLAAVLLVTVLVGTTIAVGSGVFHLPWVNRPQPADPFAQEPYHLDLPTDWMVLGEPGYDTSIDATGDMPGWLEALGLVGPNDFRAYEPVGGAGGLRLAINPTDGLSAVPDVLNGSGQVAALLPGVSGQPTADIVAYANPAQRFERVQWTETVDWGSGSAAPRSCVAYVSEGEFNPVVVVFSFPAATDRLADVEALMTSFEVTGNALTSPASQSSEAVP